LRCSERDYTYRPGTAAPPQVRTPRSQKQQRGGGKTVLKNCAKRRRPLAGQSHPEEGRPPLSAGKAGFRRAGREGEDAITHKKKGDIYPEWEVRQPNECKRVSSKGTDWGNFAKGLTSQRKENCRKRGPRRLLGASRLDLLSVR